jgi:hypothetical protein
MGPRELALSAENAALPAGNDERFNGWGIMGLPFRSGHVLAVRRFPANSIGAAYTSVWHRSPLGEWTFYGDTPPTQSCTRYFGASVERFVPAPISIEWLTATSLTIGIPDARFELTATMAATPVTSAMNAMGSVMPDSLWKSSLVLDAMAGVAGLTLGAGRLRMHGTAPNGQAFVANPMRIWIIPEARVSLAGEDFGPTGALARQAWLGDFAIPQRGIFAIGRAFFERFDSARHSAVTSLRQGPPCP